MLDLRRFTPTQPKKEQVDEALMRFKKEMSSNVNAAYKGMRELETFLDKKAESLKKDPKTAEFCDDVLKMAAAARKFSFAIAPGTLSTAVTETYKEYMSAIALKEKIASEAKQRFHEYLARAIKYTEDKLEKKQVSASDYATKHLAQTLRGIGTAVKELVSTYPELKKPYLASLKLWEGGAVPSTDEEALKNLAQDKVILDLYQTVAGNVK